MIYSTRSVGVLIQQKVRKKRKPVLILVKNCRTKVTYTSQYSVCEYEKKI